MKKYFLLICLSFVLIGCDAQPNSNQSGAQIDEPISSFINDKAIWQGDIRACFTESAEQCLIEKVKATGSPEAIKATEYLHAQGEVGYISYFNSQQLVGIAQVEYPFRANTNSASLLVPSSGQAINLEAITGILEESEIWEKFKSSHPDSSLWSPAELSKTEKSAQNIKFIFAYPIKNCHVCETQATAYIEYDFDNDGKYLASKLIEIRNE